MSESINKRHLFDFKLEDANYLLSTSGLTTPLHLHPGRMHISYTENGKGQCLVEGEVHPFTKGILHIVFPNETHKYTSDKRDPYSIYFLHYEWLGEIPAEFPRMLKLKGKSQKEVRRLCKELNHLSLFSTSATRELRKTALSELLFAEIFDCAENLESGEEPPRSHCPNTLFLDLLRTLQTPPFQFSGIDHLARSMGMSRRKFTDYFRQATGMSAMEYHLNSRRLYAETLLESGEFSLKQIAYQCGYANSQNLLRALKGAKGKE